MATRYRLYVGEDKKDTLIFCVGSRECIKILNSNKKAKREVRVENLNEIIRKGDELPDWLDGSPTLVDIKTKKIFYGRAAIVELDEISYDEEGGEEEGEKVEKVEEVHVGSTISESSRPRSHPPRATHSQHSEPSSSHLETEYREHTNDSSELNDMFSKFDLSSDRRPVEKKSQVNMSRIEKMMQERLKRTDYLAKERSEGGGGGGGG